MAETKLLQLQGRWFVSGVMECYDCGNSFTYCLPKVIMPFWEGLCLGCSVAPIGGDLPDDDEDTVIGDMPI